MDILLYSDFLAEYFSAISKPIKSSEDNIRYNIVQNPNNKIILSKHYLEYLETLFTPNHKNYNQFADLFLELIDGNKGVELPSSATSTNLLSEFTHLIINNSSTLLISISENLIAGLNGVAAIKEIIKPNWHWQICQFAAYHSISVAHHDFTNDVEIQNFFKNFINLPKSIVDFYYFDRYSQNINKHTCFQEIYTKGIPVKVYTYGFNAARKRNLTLAELQAVKTASVTSFGATCSVHYTCDKDLIHERRIMFNSLIIDTNEDFARVKKAVQTWKLDIVYSSTDFVDWLTKTPRFAEIT